MFQIWRTIGCPAHLRLWIGSLSFGKGVKVVLPHTATLTGEPVNQATQVLRNDVKGVTKHLYRLYQEQGRWRVRVVLDV